MPFQTINPANGELVKEFPTWTESELDRVLSEVDTASAAWAETPVEKRCELLRNTAQLLRGNVEEYAAIMTLEMGKLLREGRAEIEKCAQVCDYYADHAAEYLADKIVETDASRSLIAYLPLGTVLAVMPWNFPFWQVMRFAVGALAGGNAVVLKHASNVPQAALAVEEIFRKAGLPEGVFRTLMIGASQVKSVIEDDRICGVTLTGSEPAGRAVAQAAAGVIKKSVLELGGSDAFIVLDDCDMEHTVQQAVIARYQNCGQVCIAAKRFIVVDAIADEFVSRFKQAVETLQPGDPMDEACTLAPMSREDLRDELHEQVTDSIKAGAVAIIGGEPFDMPGAYYQPTILDKVKPGMRAWDEEFFGPVALIIRVKDEAEAIAVANDSRFGLGSSIWTRDTVRGEAIARQLKTGMSFINNFVKSDPRLGIGGIKASGYGRELAHLGIHEFINAKTIWVEDI
ncbi:MAG: NAD-dependent succinate-semialdehyde dehydrogenase [Gammaproteobacteria bacterium]|nr:NAD-dependent succinate-semialdehyde dehydrogenase [Gammaproteobacteria bacterium]